MTLDKECAMARQLSCMETIAGRLLTWKCREAIEMLNGDVGVY